LADPENYRYTKQHEWIRVDPGGIGTVGITDFAQRQVGDVVFVSLPKVGDQVKAGQEFASVESVKAVFEIFAPASGEVVEVNRALETNPEMVNSDAQGTAWFAKFRLANPKELEELMDATGYAAFCPQGASS
jgi:glycine cleavage system H protein